MTRRRTRKKLQIIEQRAFTLPEMLVVIAILVTIMAFGAAKFRRYLAFARQTEARENLNAIYELEMYYNSVQDVFTAMPLQGRNGAVVACTANALVFGLSPCNAAVNYGYTVALTVAGFIAQATSGTGVNNRVFPGCAIPDVWTIDQNNQLTHTVDPSPLCN